MSILRLIPQQCENGEQKRSSDDGAGYRQRERTSGVRWGRGSLSGSRGGERGERNEDVGQQNGGIRDANLRHCEENWEAKEICRKIVVGEEELEREWARIAEWWYEFIERGNEARVTACDRQWLVKLRNQPLA